MEWIKSKNSYYAKVGGAIIGEITKLQDTNTETHPYKVSKRISNTQYKPDVCFWPNLQDYLNSVESEKTRPGYFKSMHGGLEEAKKYIIDNY